VAERNVAVPAKNAAHLSGGVIVVGVPAAIVVRIGGVTDGAALALGSVSVASGDPIASRFLDCFFATPCAAPVQLRGFSHIAGALIGAEDREPCRCFAHAKAFFFPPL
jgi:hypothetical protein